MNLEGAREVRTVSIGVLFSVGVIICMYNYFNDISQSTYYLNHANTILKLDLIQ